jgi:hypothetical protein
MMRKQSRTLIELVSIANLLAGFESLAVIRSKNSLVQSLRFNVGRNLS